MRPLPGNQGQPPRSMAERFSRPALRRLREDPLNVIAQVAGAIGPRRPTSLAEARAAAYVDGQLRRAGLSVAADAFTLRPPPGWDGTAIALVALLSAVVIYWLPVLAFAGMAICFAWAAWRLARPGPPLLARRRESQNVLGTRAQPSARHRVVLLAPLDSPPTLGRYGRLFADGLRAHAGRVIACGLLLSLGLAGALFVGREWWYAMFAPALYLLGLAALDAITMRRPASPGAVSHAGALATLIAAAEELTDLQHIELWLVGLGAAECGAGLRDLLRRYPFERATTLFIELRSLGSGSLCHVTRAGLLPEIPADPLLLRCAAAADAADPLINAEPRPYRATPTIAAALGRAGWRALTVTCLDADGQAPYRATAADVPEVADEDTLNRAARLVAGLVRQIDAIDE
jgi:hypothetical protein